MALFFEDLVESIGPNDKGTLLQGIAIFTAMEMCGSFLTGKTGPKTTKLNLITFCKSHYMPNQYYAISELLYELFRNGVSHSYIPKGALIPTADVSAKPYHLDYFDAGLVIYIPQFAKDVQGAIKSLWRDIENDEKVNRNTYEIQYWKYNKGLYWNYRQIFHKLDTEGRLAYSNFIRKNNIQIKRGQFDGDISLSLE